MHLNMYLYTWLISPNSTSLFYNLEYVWRNSLQSRNRFMLPFAFSPPPPPHLQPAFFVFVFKYFLYSVVLHVILAWIAGVGGLPCLVFGGLPCLNLSFYGVMGVVVVGGGGGGGEMLVEVMGWKMKLNRCTNIIPWNAVYVRQCNEFTRFGFSVSVLFLCKSWNQEEEENGASGLCVQILRSICVVASHPRHRGSVETGNLRRID